MFGRDGLTGEGVINGVIGGLTQMHPLAKILPLTIGCGDQFVETAFFKKAQLAQLLGADFIGGKRPSVCAAGIGGPSGSPRLVQFAAEAGSSLATASIPLLGTLEKRWMIFDPLRRSRTRVLSAGFGSRVRAACRPVRCGKRPCRSGWPRTCGGLQGLPLLLGLVVGRIETM